MVERMFVSLGEEEEMVIIGIDPGLANTGWAIVETRGPSCRARAYDCIHTEAGVPLHERLGAIYSGLSRVIGRFGPTAVAIESIYFGVNTRSAIATAQARGAALAACSVAGLEMGEYAPARIKEAVVGRGDADKDQVTYMVRSILGLDHDPRPDHCADALAAAICHANLSRSLAAVGMPSRREGA